MDYLNQALDSMREKLQHIEDCISHSDDKCYCQTSEICDMDVHECISEITKLSAMFSYIALSAIEAKSITDHIILPQLLQKENLENIEKSIDKLAVNDYN